MRRYAERSLMPSSSATCFALRNLPPSLTPLLPFASAPAAPST